MPRPLTSLNLVRAYFVFLLFSHHIACQPTPTPTATPTATPLGPVQPNGLPPECQSGSTIPTPPNVNCPTVGGVSGVIAVSSFKSCSIYQNNLDCGANGNVTVLDLGLNPGTGNNLQFNFEMVPTSSTGPIYAGSGNQCPSGTCSALTEEVTLIVQSSDIVISYELTDISLEVPFIYISFSSSVYAPYWQDPPAQCGGNANNVPPEINNCVNATQPNCGGDQIGINFMQICNILASATGGHCPALGSPPPLSQQNKAYPNWPFAVCCDDDGLSSHQCASNAACGASIRAISDQNSNWYGQNENANRQAICDMPGPNTECVPLASEGLTNPIYGMVNPSGPGIPYSFNGDTNVDDDADVNDGNKPHTVRPDSADGLCARTEIDDDADDDTPRQCKKKGTQLSNLTGCRAVFGNYFSMQRRTKTQVNPNMVMPEFCLPYAGPIDGDPDPAGTYGAVFWTREVPIASGAYRVNDQIFPPFVKFGLPVITFATSNNPQELVSPYTPRLLVGTENQNNACGPDDDECCVSNVFNEDGSGAIPFITCVPGVIKNDLNQGGQGYPPFSSWIGAYQYGSACSYDRMGIITMGAGLYSEQSGLNSVKYHYTASAMAKISPMGKVFQIQEAPNPIFTVNATLTNTATGEVLDFVQLSNVAIAESCTQTNGAYPSYCYQQSSTPLVGQTQSGTNRTMLMEIIGIDTTSGAIGSELSGYIVIMNQTMPSSSIYMGDPSQININPWPGIIAALSQSGPDYKLMGVGAGVTPWPTFLGLNESQANNVGAWFYYVPPEKTICYGYGCGQIGMQNRFFGNSVNAEYMCAQDFGTCVPGYVPGVHWTLQERITDLWQNGNFGEMDLRDSIFCHTPAQVSSYFHQWMETSADCQSFFNNYTRFGYLPPGWINQADINLQQCSAPRYWINGNKLFYEDPTVNSNNVYIRLKIAVAGTLLNVQQDISSGCFSAPSLSGTTIECLGGDTPPIPGDPECGVVENSDTGGLNVWVANTGQLPGSYTVTTRCSEGSGITPLAAPVFNLQPNSSPYFVTVPLKHSGVIPSSATCQFNLTEPTYGIVFDILETVGCSVLAGNSSQLLNTNYTLADACLIDGIDCPNPQTNPTSYFAWGLAEVIFVFVFLFAGICGIACFKKGCQSAKQEISSLKKSEIIAKGISG